MHGMGNTLGFAIIQGKLLACDSDILGHIFTGSLRMSLLYALIVLVMWRYRDQRARADGSPRRRDNRIGSMNCSTGSCRRYVVEKKRFVRL